MQRALDIKRGDAVLLTADATDSVLGRSQGSGGGEQLVGMVVDLLEESSEFADGESIWGVMVNGRFEQMLSGEFAEVVSAAEDP